MARILRRARRARVRFPGALIPTTRRAFKSVSEPAVSLARYDADAARLPEQPVESYLYDDAAVARQLSEIRDYAPHAGVLGLDQLQHHRLLEPLGGLDALHGPLYRPRVGGEQALHGDLEGLLGLPGQVLDAAQGLLVHRY